MQYTKENELQLIRTTDALACLVAHLSVELGGSSVQGLLDKIHGIEDRPEPESEIPCTGKSGHELDIPGPVYTQEQASNDWLPDIGAECIVIPHNTVWGFTSTEKQRGVIVAFHDERFWWKGSYNCISRVDKVDFEAIDTRTPEQRAFDEFMKSPDPLNGDGTCNDDTRVAWYNGVAWGRDNPQITR